MSEIHTKYKFIFAGGGTGGHLYPAIAVAEQIRKLMPDSDILFVGTKDKLEARVVPQNDFKFRSIWISGFSRKLTFKNILFPLKLVVSVIQSLIINMKFKPCVAIGTGAYVAGPVMWAAWVMGAKVILLEQNSYPGITNRLLEKKAAEIYLMFEESKKYFREKDKLQITGNPLRVNIKLIDKTVARKKMEIDVERKTILVLGGSLGALSVNEALKENLENLIKSNIQVIWQTGKFYFDKYRQYNSKSALVIPFIEDMSAAYSSCDLLIARAGATTIAEASRLGIPVIFVPSKNVAADHQKKNAAALVKNNAAIMIEDDKLKTRLLDEVVSVINNQALLEQYSKNIKKFSKPGAAEKIANNVIKLAEAA